MLINTPLMRSALWYTGRKAHIFEHISVQRCCCSKTTWRVWFHRLKEGDFDVLDRPREGRPKNFEDTVLEALFDDDPCQTQEILASALGVTSQAIIK